MVYILNVEDDVHTVAGYLAVLYTYSDSAKSRVPIVSPASVFSTTSNLILRTDGTARISISNSSEIANCDAGRSFMVLRRIVMCTTHACTQQRDCQKCMNNAVIFAQSDGIRGILPPTGAVMRSHAKYKPRPLRLAVWLIMEK